MQVKISNLFEYKSGLPVTPQYTSFTLVPEDGILYLHAVKPKAFRPSDVLQTFKIPMENIVDIGMFKKTELDNAVVGRGVAGGVLMGSAGAMLGGMSGMVKDVSIMALAYLSPNAPDTLKTLLFDGTSWEGFNKVFVQELKSALRKREPSPMVQAYLGDSGYTEESDGSISL